MKKKERVKDPDKIKKNLSKTQFKPRLYLTQLVVEHYLNKLKDNYEFRIK